MEEVRALIPAVFAPLLTTPKRIKFYYGGRCGGKSYAFADSLLILGQDKKLFIACVREIQDSIKDSVYKLLCDRIAFYDFTDYRVFEDRIDNLVTGTRFIFKGLREQDSQKIKSLEGADICWIEEAQTISKSSWEVLEPTIRKPNSEIWVSMNRLGENDALWVAVGAKPDENTLVCKVNYYNNPFCPQVMHDLAQKCRIEDFETYLHVWEGEPRYKGDDKLFSSKSVRAAMVPKMDASTSPLIIGVDVARSGDDSTVICYRRGRWCLKIDKHKGLKTDEVANMLTVVIKQYQPRKVFIDAGYNGIGVYDILVARGYGEIVKAINFGSKPIDDDRFFNKRSEMYGLANSWISGDLPVQIPDDNELMMDLLATKIVHNDKYGRLKLVDKDEIKKDIGRSPDKADAFVLTFAEPVLDLGMPKVYGNGQVRVEDMFRNSNKNGLSW